jgi:hypothetical protein
VFVMMMARCLAVIVQIHWSQVKAMKEIGHM